MTVTVEQLSKSGMIKSQPEVQDILTLESIKNILTQQKSISREKKDYLYSYLILENYFLQNNPVLTKKDVRTDINTKFNTSWFSPRVRALFNLQNPDAIIFTELILESFANELITQMSTSTLNNIFVKEEVAVSFINNKLVLDKFEKYFFQDQTHLDQSLLELDKIIKLLYTFSKNNLGTSATDKLLNDAFQKLRAKYVQFPAFLEAVKGLPDGILDREKLTLLSKEQLEKVSARMKDIDTMKSDFTNMAAHELKTPIIPMKGYMEMMLKYPKKYGLNRKGIESIKIFKRNTDRLEALINDILDASKLDAGEMKFNMQKVVLAKTISDVITDLQPLAKEKNILLKCILPPPKKRPSIKADPKRLAQVIGNLVNNAIKFTDKGSVVVKVEIKNSKLHLSFTDTGMGIAKNDLEHIFEKFYQSQDISTRKTKGTGLGLAISKKIVEAHQGKIWVTSLGKNKGSTFHVMLPIIKT